MNETLNKFAAFILTHNRANRVTTYKTLRRDGYTGRIVLICDDQDPALKDYQIRYPGEVEIFNKREIAQTFDVGDNFQEFRSVVYARNACFEIARRLGLESFLQLDDDYSQFQYRWGDRETYNSCLLSRKLDLIFEAMIQFLRDTRADSIAFAQGGDYIGGKTSNIAFDPLRRRKVMNSFFCLTDRPFQFKGIMNDDVNTYVEQAAYGKLFFTMPQIALMQTATQQHEGGLTDIYKTFGTYVKSFYTVMFQPSSVFVTVMGDPHPRLHHRITWADTVPMLLSEKHKKQ